MPSGLRTVNVISYRKTEVHIVHDPYLAEELPGQVPHLGQRQLVGLGLPHGELAQADVENSDSTRSMM